MKFYHLYYYTLKELLVNGNSLSSAMTEYYGTLPAWYTNPESPYLEELYNRLKNMFNRKGVYFGQSYYNYDTNDTSELDLAIADNASRIEDLFETIYETKEKYIEVIKAQATLKSDLLKPIENVTKHYTNDTPESNGSYIDEGYTSTYSKDIQEIDLGSVSQKLAEIDVAMDDHYDRWLNHFKRFRLLEED